MPPSIPFEIVLRINDYQEKAEKERQKTSLFF
jgi:hypothetical protein